MTKRKSPNKPLKEQSIVMGNTIQAELKLAKTKMIEEVESNGHMLARLTRDNVAIVEAMIRNDSAYIKSTNIDACPNNRYGGSSAYWMTHLKNYLTKRNYDCEHTYEEVIEGAINAVDRENSTHLNADGHGREVIKQRLCEFNKKELIKCLKNPDYENMKLIREIAQRTSEERNARTNPSFASKFCHYACFYIFEGTENQDNYSIYDSILKKVLPWYLEHYEIDGDYNLKDYRDYRMAVDAIRTASGIEISRNGFDHLLWYYHKGRL